jgi:glucose-1-phosphate cytidylyltransferase
MKVVIFAGGLGTRLMEETEARPKPMVEIGGKPIIWHIMKIYAAYGYNEFIICLGYKGYMIKEYFMNYFLHNSDLTIDLKNNKLEIHETRGENFKVTLAETGINTKTAGRLKRIRNHVEGETFMLTYGDGLTDLNINDLVTLHKKSGRIATLTSIQPAGRFGSLEIEENGNVKSFVEKPKGDGFWINGGFFVLEPGVFDFLPNDSDEIMWEEEPLSNLASAGQLSALKYRGFWKCMDHLRDKVELEKLWSAGSPPWKVW